MTASPPLYECLEPPLSYATQACLAVDCSQPVESMVARSKIFPFQHSSHSSLPNFYRFKDK